MAPKTEPRVICVLLTRDRPELAKRAVDCFKAQTYENKRLFVFNTGRDDWLRQEELVYSEHYPHFANETIGELRNFANSYSNPNCLKGDIIAHWDDDDYSPPHRLTEQVALLQASGADAVGYNEMLFWRTPPVTGNDWTKNPPVDYGEAWLYTNHRPGYVLGTSLMYWRSVWEAKPFPDLPKAPGGTGEDTEWICGLKVIAQDFATRRDYADTSPRMVARIHGQNYGTYNLEEQIAQGSQEWRRVPQWDIRVRELLK